MVTTVVVSMMRKMMAMRLIRLMQYTRCSSPELSGSKAPPNQVFSQCCNVSCIALHCWHILHITMPPYHVLPCRPARFSHSTACNKSSKCSSACAAYIPYHNTAPPSNVSYQCSYCWAMQYQHALQCLEPCLRIAYHIATLVFSQC